MDDQRNWIAARKFLCPTDDELFGIIIEALSWNGEGSIELNNCSIRSTKTSIDGAVSYATSNWRFNQVVVTTGAQALRRRRGLFGLFLPTENLFAFNECTNCVSHRAVLQQQDELGCHCSSNEVVPPNDQSALAGG